MEIQSIWFTNLEELKQLGKAPLNLQYFTDYQAIDRDMEIKRGFLVIDKGVFKYMN